MSLSSTILALNPITYWKLDETSGTAAINYGTLGTAANGTYNGVTLNQIDAPGGGRAGLWDGANDFINAYSAALAAAFNGSLFTTLVFAKVYNVGVYTDSTIRTISKFQADATSNYSRIARSSTNNRVAAYYGGGWTAEFAPADGLTSTDWVLYTITLTDAGDQFKFCVNSAQAGSTQTGIGTWVGSLSSLLCSIGGNIDGTQSWYGYLSHVAIFNSVLTAEQIAAIYAAGMQQAYSLTADAGSIAVTGQDATLTAYLKKLGCVTAGDMAAPYTVTAGDTGFYTVTASNTCLYTVTASDMKCT